MNKNSPKTHRESVKNQIELYSKQIKDLTRELMDAKKLSKIAILNRVIKFKRAVVNDLIGAKSLMDYPLYNNNKERYKMFLENKIFVILEEISMLEIEIEALKIDIIKDKRASSYQFVQDTLKEKKVKIEQLEDEEVTYQTLLLNLYK